MHSYLIGAICLLAGYATYYIITSFLESRRHARNAAHWGCRPAPRRPHSLPFGLDLVQQVMKADRELRVPDLFVEVYNKLGGHHTWAQQYLGAETFVTVDPKNIQALLATKFNDFSTGETRRANFFPMLGNGIFTSDGKVW